MSCFYPLPASRNRESERVFIGRHLPAAAGESPELMGLPCGVCVGCRADKARAWAIRCMHEAQLYDANRFVTLTYDEAHLPVSLSLEYSDFQLFMRRLRKKVRGVNPSPAGTFPVRFFVAGEYGEKYKRPHWHAILFNTYFADEVRLVNGTSRSTTLESIWQRGNVVIGDVTPQSASYVAGYTLNKRYGRGSEDYYEDVVNPISGEVFTRRKEFCQMSRDPGIGSWWFDRFSMDLFPNDTAVHSGRPHKVPSYYWRKFKETGNPEVVERIAEGRRQRAARVPYTENYAERRNVRAAVLDARMRERERNL